jgi:undecaprenyl-diphosphatase
VVPAALLDDVARGPGAAGFFFPSLHTGVIAAVATSAGPYVTRVERRASWVLIVAVAVADVFLGEALPLGIFAGAVFGWGVGTLVHLALGAPGRRAAEPSVQVALRRFGIVPVSLVRTKTQLLRPQLYEVTTAEGAQLQVKVVRHLHRLAGPGHRVRRILASLDVDPEPALSTPRHEVSHEAYITLLAERAGVGTLPVLLAGEIEHGPPFLVRHHVDGTRLRDLAPEAVHDAHLDAMWVAVLALGEARIVHHDLRATNILIDEHGAVRITDFTFGRVVGQKSRNVQDVAELLVSLTAVVGVERAVDSAIRILPHQAVRDTLPYLHSVALPGRFRRQLHDGATLVRLRETVAERLDCDVPPFRSPVRPGTVGILAAGGLAVYLLLPELSSLAAVRSVIESARWDWLGVTIVLGLLAVLGSGLTIIGSARQSLPVVRTLAVQMAAAFTGRTTIAAVGYYTIHLSYFSRLGMSRTDAVGVLLLNRAATVVVTAIGTIIGILVIGNAVPVGEFSFPWWIWVVAAGVLVSAIAFLASPLGRARVWRPGRAMLRRLIQTTVPTMRQPMRAAQLIVGEIAFLAFSALGLATTLSALGATYHVGAVIAVFVVGSTLGQLLPTPGGLGAVEGALVAGLTAIGVPPTDAVAATLTARVLTFWLPVLPGIAVFRLLQHNGVV